MDGYFRSPGRLAASVVGSSGETWNSIVPLLKCDWCPPETDTHRKLYSELGYSREKGRHTRRERKKVEEKRKREKERAKERNRYKDRDWNWDR